MMKKHLAVCTLALIAGAPAAAQTGADERASEDVIVVTGEKVDRSLQETVTSVGLITGEQLERDAVASLFDSFDYLANVNRNDIRGGFTIRGVPFDNLLGAGSSPLAQIYVDDVTLGDKTTRFAADGVWDVAQIEVLRGAQSTVQGRNALAGAIVIRTQDPGYEWTGKARSLWLNSEFGDEYVLSAALGGPMVKDVLAFRVAAERRESDGFIDNPVRGLDGDDFADHWQARAKILFEPAPNVSSLFAFSYGDATTANRASDRRARDADGFAIIDEIVPGSERLRQSFINTPDFNRNRTYNYSLKTDWDVSGAATLTSITAYSDSRNDDTIDSDRTNLDPALFPDGAAIINNPFNIPNVPASLPRFNTEGSQLEEQTIFTQEVTIHVDDGGPLRGLFGAYYADSREDEFNFLPGVQPGLHEVIGDAIRAFLGPGPATDFIIATALPHYADLGTFIALTSEPLDVKNYAVYASGELDLAQRLTVGFGVRYDHEKQVEGLTLSGDPLGLPDPAATPLPGVIALINGELEGALMEASTVATQRFGVVLPSGFVRYEIDDDRSVSFSMRRGYRSGGSDLNIPRQFVSQFDPEFTLNYELALRSFWFDRALRVNANLFYTDWTDQQLVVSLSTLQQDEVGFNVGKSTLKGFEIDAAWTPSPNWFVQGALGYADTQFMDFDAALAEALIEAQSVAAPFDLEETLAAFSGREFAFAPRWSGAARIAYTADNGLFAVLGVTYEGESFVNNAQSASPTFLDNDARALVNLTAGYERDGVEIAFVAKNLFNETYVASGGDELVRLGAPRELGVQAKAAF